LISIKADQVSIIQTESTRRFVNLLLHNFEKKNYNQPNKLIRCKIK